MDEERAAGWYPDPEMVDTVRYWSGTSWTEHRAPAGSGVPETPPGVTQAPIVGEDEQPGPNVTPGKGCLAVVAIVLGVVFISSLFDGDEDDGGGEYGARSVCEKFVKDRLKSPSTADFSDTTATTKGTAGYLVRGAVDSENSFGAMIRNTYTCEVSYTGDDNWHLVDLQFSGN